MENMKLRKTSELLAIMFVIFMESFESMKIGIIKDESIVQCKNILQEFSHIARDLEPICVDSSKISEGVVNDLKDVKCIIDFSMNNEDVSNLGEMLQIPVITNAPNIAPTAKFTISMYPDYKLVNKIIVETLNLWGMNPVALLYDVKRSEQAANLQSLARKNKIQMMLMPEINMNDEHSVAYAAGELKRSHLTSGILLSNPQDIYKVMDKTLEFNLYEDLNGDAKWRWLASDLDFKPNHTCTPTLDGFVGFAMTTSGIEGKRENFIKRILTPKQRIHTQLSNNFFASLHDSMYLVINSLQERHDCDECLLNILRTAILPSCLDQQSDINCGLTGKVQFLGNETRDINEMKVVEIQKGSTALQTIGVWSLEKGTLSKNNAKWVTKDERRQCFNKQHKQDKKRTYRILVKTDDHPFVFINPNQSLPMEKRFTGFCIDILRELSKECNMNFNFTIEIENSTGTWSDNSSRWSGIIGKLIRKDADMATGSLTITAEREKTIDYSKPFMDFTMALILRKPDKEEQNMFRFLDPFSPMVWFCTVFAVFAMTIFAYIVDYLSPYGYRKTAMGTEEPGDEFSLYNSLWFSTASMLQQGGDNTPKSPSGRLLAASFWFFVLLMISTYTANLAAFFTNKKPTVTIGNLEDLAGQSKIKYGVYKGGQIHTFLENSNDTVHRTMVRHITAYNTFAKGASDGVGKARKGGFAYLTETPILEYHITRKPCNTMLVKHLLESKSYGFALPKNSELTTNLSVNILELREKGFMDSKYTEWWKTKSQCPTTVKPKGLESMTIQFKNMAGVFIVLVSGVIIAFILLVVEVKFKWLIDLILEAGCEQCTDYYCEEEESYEYMDPIDATAPSTMKRVPDAYSNAQESKV